MQNSERTGIRGPRPFQQGNGRTFSVRRRPVSTIGISSQQQNHPVQLTQTVSQQERITPVSNARIAPETTNWNQTSYPTSSNISHNAFQGSNQSITAPYPVHPDPFPNASYGINDSGHPVRQSQLPTPPQPPQRFQTHQKSMSLGYELNRDRPSSSFREQNDYDYSYQEAPPEYKPIGSQVNLSNQDMSAYIHSMGINETIDQRPETPVAPPLPPKTRTFSPTVLMNQEETTEASQPRSSLDSRMTSGPSIEQLEQTPQLNLLEQVGKSHLRRNSIPHPLNEPVDGNIYEEPELTGSSQRPELPPKPSDPTDSKNSIEPPFWKYYIQKNFNDFYFTTNPDSDHLQCPKGPSYYVEVIHQGHSPRGHVLFTLKLVDQETSAPAIEVSRLYDNTSNADLFEVKKYGCNSHVEWTSQATRISTTKTEQDDLKQYLFFDNLHRGWIVGTRSDIRYSEHSDSDSSDGGNSRPIKWRRSTKVYFFSSSSSDRTRTLAMLQRRKQLHKRLIQDISHLDKNFKRMSRGPGYGGDGVADDGEEENTNFGWLTVYDKVKSLDEGEMWSVIVGVTFAVGYGLRMDKKKKGVGKKLKDLGRKYREGREKAMYRTA